MHTRRTRLATALCTALVLGAAGARAGDTGPAPEVEVPQAAEPAGVEQILEAADEAKPFTGIDARQDWQSRRSWGYGTQNLYPATRGMQDAGIPRWARWPLYPFTAVFDTGNLVFSAIGGLYGD
jgi:hypothetical protein